MAVIQLSETAGNVDESIEYRATYQDTYDEDEHAVDNNETASEEGKPEDTAIPKDSAIPQEYDGENSSISQSNAQSSTKTNDLNDDVAAQSSLSKRWTALINKGHKPLVSFLQAITHVSSRYPKRTILAVTFLSIFMAVTGLITNFNVDVDEEVLWTPRDSQAASDKKWLDNDSGFPVEPRWFILLFHFDGKNVLGQSQVQKMFDVADAVRSVTGYTEMCANTGYIDRNGVETCRLEGPINFWNASSAIYHEQVSSDEECIEQLSATQFPDLFPVAEEVFFGYPERDESGLLTNSVSYSIFIEIPHADVAEDVEERALEAVLYLNDKWNSQPGNDLHVEVAAHRSFADEFTRAIIIDIPLVPIVFIIMSAFTCLVFYKKHKVQSRSLLGVSAVVSVMLSICTAYGILFIAGVPFTSITQMLPFILFGIGLDDAFIIMGSYARTDNAKATDVRIRETIDDVGVSITLTTTTSAFAFALGCTSSIPAVFWVSLYAFPSVIMVFFYQLTFFVSCIVLDQRRITENRRDCCTWVHVPVKDETSEEETEGSGVPGTVSDNFTGDRFMERYAEVLLKPWVKVLVVIAFGVLGALCAISTTKLRQEFNFQDVLPSDSYITSFIEGREAYSSRSHLLTSVYFRDVDQSDPYIQQQMFDYVDQLVATKAVTGEPDFFWLRDLQLFVDNYTLHQFTFVTQLALFLEVDIINEVYGKDIVRDEDGNVIESRLFIDMGNVEADDIKGQMNALRDERRITSSLPVNQGKSSNSFFTYSIAYNIWEFYDRAVDELTFTAITGVIAVTVIAFLMIPHWSAAFIVLPMMCILYIDILGVMQWGGVTINPVSYVALAMSVGLLVDFIMHVLLKYYESPGTRREKTIEMLRTMGSSIFLGGLTTFLGTVPLVFSTSEIFYTIFIGFMGLVTLGVSHGLILLPVILSTIGTEEQVTTALSRVDGKKNTEDFATSSSSSVPSTNTGNYSNNM